MMKKILAFGQRRQSLRDRRRCATVAAARPSPLRDRRRCATVQS